MECHAGLTQFAAPIVVQDQHLGTILLGERPRTPLSEDNIRRLAREFDLNLDELRRAAWALRPWSDPDMQPAVEFLSYMANALARRCYQEVQLRDRVQELSALYRLSSMLAGTADVQSILDRSAQLIVEVLGAKASSIRLLNDSTGELKIQAVHNLSPQYLNKGGISVRTSPIDIEALEKGIVYIGNQPEDPRTVYPAHARAEGIVSALVAAMRYRGTSIGVMRVYTGEHREFSSFERSLMQTMASPMAAAIIDARLRQEALEAERLEQQVSIAATIQRQMIPATPPRHPFLDIGAVYSPSLELGGDFYDFIELPHGNLGLTIADVAGKGIPASLTMASARAALRAHAKSIYDIDRIMSEVNRHICRDVNISEFVTAFYGVFSPDGRRLTYCNAGHERPLLLRDLCVAPLEVGGLMLGVEPTAKYDKGLLHLRPGDVLLFSTDGLPEGMNFTDEMYDRHRVIDSLRTHYHLDAGSIAKQILWDLRRFRGLAEQSDDVSIVVVKVR